MPPEPLPVIKAITFDLWDTVIHDDSDEAKRAARGLPSKREARRSLSHGLFEAQTGVAREVFDLAYDTMESAFNHVWHEQHVTWTVAERVQVLASAFRCRLPEAERDALVRRLEEMEVEVPPDPVEGIGDAIAELAARFPLAVVSDAIYSPGRCLRRVARHARPARPLSSAFGFSDEIGFSKPHRVHVRARRGGARRAKIDEMLHIGDRDHNDVKGPQALGMKAVLFTASRDRDRDATSADAVCERASELAGTVLRLAAAGRLSGGRRTPHPRRRRLQEAGARGTRGRRRHPRRSALRGHARALPPRLRSGRGVSGGPRQPLSRTVPACATTTGSPGPAPLSPCTGMSPRYASRSSSRAPLSKPACRASAVAGPRKSVSLPRAGAVRRIPRGREMGIARKIALTPEGRAHPLYIGKASVFDAFISHEDEITHLPPGAVNLASNAFTRVQAVSVVHRGRHPLGAAVPPRVRPPRTRATHLVPHRQARRSRLLPGPGGGGSLRRSSRGAASGSLPARPRVAPRYRRGRHERRRAPRRGSQLAAAPRAAEHAAIAAGRLPFPGQPRPHRLRSLVTVGESRSSYSGFPLAK